MGSNPGEDLYRTSLSFAETYIGEEKLEKPDFIKKETRQEAVRTNLLRIESGAIYHLLL